MSGLRWGFAGVVAFSFTVIFTRIAVRGLPPLFIGAGRAVVAAVLAALVLSIATRYQPRSQSRSRPRGRQWAQLAVVAAGVVLGFPVLTSYALSEVPAGHGAVVIAILPAATAVAVVVRTGERPARSFWVFALVGAVAAIGFAALGSGGLGELHGADLLLFGAVVAGAVGYAEGGLLSRRLGSWQTISWALVVAAPVMLALTGLSIAQQDPQAQQITQATAGQWAAFGYLSVVSMFLGFFAWYRGLAIGPMAQVSQVQLAQPVLTLAWAALLLGETLTAPTLAGGLAVVGCAALAVRTRLSPSSG
ncbi:DMT family transporter [Kineosporia rhizophila]|nr:DMT family transporter [Kineosporia sp. NBRC 101677]MCE0536488.1 DMT family transporter [Kineosporia rhizophila]